MSADGNDEGVSGKVENFIDNFLPPNVPFYEVVKVIFDGIVAVEGVVVSESNGLLPKGLQEREAKNDVNVTMEAM